MSGVLATVVDTTALLKVIGAAFAAGVGVTAAFSFAIRGATRFAEVRRDGRQGAAGLYAALTTLALACCLGAIVLGVYVMIKK